MTIDFAEAFKGWDKVFSGEDPELLDNNMLMAIGTIGVRDTILGMAALGTKQAIGGGVWLDVLNESWADEFDANDEVNGVNALKFSTCVYSQPND